MTSSPTVVWFRRDLRLADNPALATAADLGPVVPLFILDDADAARPPGGASKWWLDKSLRSLAADLARAGAPLVLRRGRAPEILDQVVAETGARRVVWNRLYDRAAIDRDTQIKAQLRRRGIEVRSFNSALLNEPWDVSTASGEPYKVFTPYWRAARPLAESGRPGRSVAALSTSRPHPQSDTIDSWGLHPCRPDWSTGFSDWTPGESGAHERLRSFLEAALGRYPDDRDKPGHRGTSRLSPHLHFGEIGPRQVWSAAREAVLVHGASERSVESFLRELGWREFNHHLLFHFPDLDRAAFNRRFEHFEWREDPAGLHAWRRGQTGYPIVDAGMRELWVTGWMHNRVRMIAGSFLVKDLLVHWRDGEAWFWDTLVDADLANNLAGWQWVAGTGADAAPYFRVFNPMLQGAKFDQKGDYVRRWVPELARLPDEFIHQPWRADPGVLADAGVRLGDDYPHPIVDHAFARDRALAAYERVK